MANKKIQKRNKKRKQEQMRSVPAPSSATKEPARKSIGWLKIAGVVLLAVLLVGAFVVKFLFDRSLATSASEQDATVAVSSSPAAVDSSSDK